MRWLQARKCWVTRSLTINSQRTSLAAKCPVAIPGNAGPKLPLFYTHRFTCIFATHT